ncbi:AraC family transcriptional regulator [Chelatococcus reniformis]|uniref:AraC family transcriptional regulator n=1 Tax=Chelatococcus reniformis TaxID=1494448 RepID=A0A916UU96_9HYPH|nr:AraC family transcriptional regulator [Chelatococcus reniformis]GGC87060.1 AraC family transcriptional regulator [Chelatococcus reniformis]
MAGTLKTIDPRRTTGAGAAAPPRAPRAGDRREIDAGYADLVMSGVRQAGYDGDAILRRAGIDPAILAAPHGRLSQRQFAALISLLTRLTRDEIWLLCSRPIKPGTFRLMCRLLVRCANLREAIRAGCQFYHLLIDDFTVRFQADTGEGRIWLVDSIGDAERRRMLNGAVLFFVYGLMCWLVGRKLPLTSVHYVFSARPHSAELEPVYEAPILFDQPRTELRFEAELLDLPILPDEERLRRFLAVVPATLLVRYRDDTGIPERARAILRRNLGRNLTLEDVAARLHVSPQTLRRRLQEDQQGFQDLKDRVRRDVAVHLLRKSRLSLDDVAAALGFSEVSTFHRAFRRWTGQTPGECRHGGQGEIG